MIDPCKVRWYIVAENGVESRLLTKFWTHLRNEDVVKLCLYNPEVVPPQLKISCSSSKGSLKGFITHGHISTQGERKVGM